MVKPQMHEYLWESVVELKKKGVLESVTLPNNLLLLASFPKKKIKCQAVIDLSNLNKFMLNKTFHMETALSVQNSLRPGL